MPVAVPVAVSVTETAVVAGRFRVAVTVTVPPFSATVLLAAFVVSASVEGGCGVTVTVTDPTDRLLG